MTALFTAAQLTELLGKPVTPARAEVVERVAWGWLKPILGWDERPAENEVPDELFGWALRLGAIVAENPAALEAKTVGPFTEQYAKDIKAILDEVRASTLPTGAAAAANRPRGNFPEAPCYPDPAW